MEWVYQQLISNYLKENCRTNQDNNIEMSMEMFGPCKDWRQSGRGFENH